MANEPNNAEEQLKQYAADRRQLVPGEIHPATRNLLQGEVARTYGGAGAEARKPVRLRWLPALVWIAILGAIPLFFLPRSPETKKTQEALPSKDEVVLPTQSKPGEAPIVISDTKTPVKAPNVNPPETRSALSDAVAPAPVTVAPTTTATGPVLREEAQLAGSSRNVLMERARTVEAVPKSQVGRAASEPNPTATAAAPAADKVAAASNQRFSFVNNSATPQALNRFEIEQAGARFRVLDSDGSVYPGRTLSNGTFHVAGMNRTLKQPVVFTGQVFRASLSISTNQQQQLAQQQIAPASANNAPAQNQNQRYLNNANNSVSNNSDELRVQGQALIGNNQYKVDAQAAPGQ